MTEQFEFQTLQANGQTIAYRIDGEANPALPNLLFLPGFFSDMTGSKASFLAARCTDKDGANRRQLVRLDYRGHGKSSGKFIDGCIGDWLADALAVVDKVTTGKLILVGSSMGGWIMLLIALARPERIAGLVGIAAAPDFTEDLMWDLLTPAQRHEMQSNGVLYEPSDYGAPVAYTLKLVEEGRKHLLLRAPIPITCPVRLIQGKEDKDVPWQVAEKLAGRLQSKDVKIHYIDDGEHRLSRDSDLEILWSAIEAIS